MALSFRFHSPYLAPFSQDPLPFLMDAVRAAKRRIDLCLGREAVELLVVQAARVRNQGVLVRWIIDFEGSTPEQMAETERLLGLHGFRKQLDWRGVKAARAFFAQSYLVIDAHRVVYSTSRWTRAALYLQEAAYAVVDSAEFAGGFLRATDLYWDDLVNVSREAGTPTFLPALVPSIESVTVGPDQRVSAFFAPFDGKVIEERLLDVVQQAERSLFFALPCLDDPRLVDALEDRARAGVQIRGVLDAHLSRIEHFERAPTLRALALAGKIRFMRAFAKQGRRYEDLAEYRMVTADEQFVFLWADRLGRVIESLRGQQQAPCWRAESALLLDSPSVARQAVLVVQMLHEMARDGGHRFMNWAHAERYAHPKAWSEEQVVPPASKKAVPVKAVPVKARAKKAVAKKKAPARKKVAARPAATRSKKVTPLKRKAAAGGVRKRAVAKSAGAQRRKAA